MATPIWNQRNLTSPPIVHLPVSFTLSENVTLQKYQAILTDMKAELRLLNVMQKEAWIFHRILSKCEESEKNMKWFRECKAILNCFDRLRKMKIEDITAAMQPQTDNDNLQGSNRWPSCQMLEYFLVRLIGFAALCQYIWSKGYKTNQLLLQNIEKNILFFRHFSKFGCISRMQILSEHLLEKSCRWYTVLYPWLQCLPKLEADWLPEGATLPNSVEEALGDKLVELRNIASQRGTKKENVRKSILDKIFGMRDSEDMLPQLVLKDDVVSKSSGMKKEAESTKSVEMSLDDIFNGLVDLSVKKTSTSMLKQKGEGSRREDNSKIMEDNDKITPNMISKDGELSTKNNRQNREDKLKATQSSYCKSEVDVNQSQDLGVPISREEHQEQTKRKKKKRELKRKRNEDDVFGDSDVHKRMKEQPMKKEETFIQDHLLKGENGGLKDEKANELVNNSHGKLLTDNPRVEDEQTQPANIAKKKKKKRKNKLSGNISKKELFDEWLMMSETLSGSNAPTDDSHMAKKKLKRSKVGTEQATDECDALNNLGIRTSPLNSNKTRERQKAELGHNGIGLNSPGMEKSSEVPLGPEAGTTPVVDSDVISKKRKKKHWKNIDNVEEERLSFHSQHTSVETLKEHEMQSASTVKEETAAPMKTKKKKNVNHSSLYDESGRASLEGERQTDIPGPSGGAEEAGNNNNGLDLRSAAEMNALVLKSNVTNGNKKKRKKKKKRFLTDI